MKASYRRPGRAAVAVALLVSLAPSLALAQNPPASRALSADAARQALRAATSPAGARRLQSVPRMGRIRARRGGVSVENATAFGQGHFLMLAAVFAAASDKNAQAKQRATELLTGLGRTLQGQPEAALVDKALQMVQSGSGSADDRFDAVFAVIEALAKRLTGEPNWWLTTGVISMQVLLLDDADSKDNLKKALGTIGQLVKNAPQLPPDVSAAMQKLAGYADKDLAEADYPAIADTVRALRSAVLGG